MRLRNVKGAREELAESVYVIETPQEHKGGWNKLFGNDNPIRIEIGMGKGIFLLTLAKQNPDINYVGIEMYASVLVRAVQKLEEKAGECENTVETPDRTETDPAEEGRPAAETMTLPNLRLLNMPAEYLDQVFAPGEVERIYLNFSDPWPKARHAKRRLTSPAFLARYRSYLAPEGLLEFKTDNRPLFDFSLESVQESGWRLLSHTFDLHHDPELCAGNVMTEYERKFSEKGQPICKLTAKQPTA